MEEGAVEAATSPTVSERTTTTLTEDHCEKAVEAVPSTPKPADPQEQKSLWYRLFPRISDSAESRKFPEPVIRSRS